VTNRNSIKYCRKTANINVKNLLFITSCKAHRSLHIQNGKNLIPSICGYNKNCVLYPQTWVDEIKYLAFYMCDERRALHAVIKQKVFYIYFLSQFSCLPSNEVYTAEKALILHKAHDRLQRY